MRLYHIQFDHESHYIEAETMQDAITKWQKHQKEAWSDEPNSGWDGTEQPDSCALVHEDPVIR